MVDQAIRPKPFVSRDIELSQLNQALQEVIELNCTYFIMIQGDFGVGKSALVEDFLKHLSERFTSVHNKPLVAQSKCSMEKDNDGLAPFATILNSLTYQSFNGKVIRQKVFKFLQRISPFWAELASGSLIGTTSRTIKEAFNVFGRAFMPPESIFTQYANALNDLSQHGPLIVYIDDLHWADELSLKLLFHLFRHLSGIPILFICTYRPVETATGLNAISFSQIHANLIREGAIEINLYPRIDVREYIRGNYTLPESLIKALKI